MTVPPEERAPIALGALRIIVFVVWIASVAGTGLADLATLPRDALRPLWLLHVVPEALWPLLFDARVLTVIEGGLLVGLALLALGVPGRTLRVVTMMLLLLEQTLIRCFGHVSHQEIVPLLAAAILMAWPAGDRLALPRRAPAPPSPLHASGIALVAVLGCWTYTAVGAHRLAHFGLDIVAGRTMSVQMIENSFRYGDGGLAIAILGRPALVPLIQMATAVTTLLEIAAPLALLSRRFRRAWIVFLVLFHTASGLLLRVYFWQVMIVLAAALVAYDWAVDPPPARS